MEKDLIALKSPSKEKIADLLNSYHKKVLEITEIKQNFKIYTDIVVLSMLLIIFFMVENNEFPNTLHSIHNRVLIP